MSGALTVVEESRLEEIATEIQAIQGAATFKIGERLMEAQAIYKHRQNGEGFIAWMESRLGISKVTGYNLINVAANLGSEFVQRLNKLPAGALYELASPNTPAEVRSEVVARVEAGERISRDDVRALKGALPAAPAAPRPLALAGGASDDVAVLKHKLAEQKAKAKEAQFDADRLRSVNSELSSSSDQAQRALAMARSRIAAMDEEMARLKESGVIHVLPAEAPVAAPAPNRFLSFAAYEAAVSEIFFAGSPEWQQMVLENLRAVVEDAA